MLVCTYCRRPYVAVAFLPLLSLFCIFMILWIWFGSFRFGWMVDWLVDVVVVVFVLCGGGGRGSGGGVCVCVCYFTVLHIMNTTF